MRRRLTTLERGIVLLGMLLVCLGGFAAIDPGEMNVFHHSTRGPVFTEEVSAAGLRIYGILTALFGAALIWLALPGQER